MREVKSNNDQGVVGRILIHGCKGMPVNASRNFKMKSTLPHETQNPTT